jgi:hypothetical protein
VGITSALLGLEIWIKVYCNADLITFSSDMFCRFIAWRKLWKLTILAFHFEFLCRHLIFWKSIFYVPFIILAMLKISVGAALWSGDMKYYIVVYASCLFSRMACCQGELALRVWWDRNWRIDIHILFTRLFQHTECSGTGQPVLEHLCFFKGWL